MHRRAHLRYGGTDVALVVDLGPVDAMVCDFESAYRQQYSFLMDGQPLVVDPVMLEIFKNLYMSIAEQMGVRLANTAHSVDIQERLDFSCALFDGEGNLVANAPHMPVRLGSMGESVKTVIRENRGRIRAGNVYVVNAPYNGGTHLPDGSVITPVFDAAGEEILFFIGSIMRTSAASRPRR